MENAAQSPFSGEIMTLALVGLLIVFFVLTVIALAIALVRKIDDRLLARAAARDEQPAPQDPNIDALTAVLIAAAAATVLKGRHRIRSVRRLLPLDAPRSPWSGQGRLYLQGSHSVPRKRHN